MIIKPFNPETGEIVEGRIAWIPNKHKNGFEGWFAMSQNAMREILDLKIGGKLSGRDLDVLLLLTTMLDFENDILVNQTEIAERLNMQRSHVSRSISSLVDHKLIIEGEKFGRSRTYKLNPNVGWKGSAKDHKKHLRLVHSQK